MVNWKEINLNKPKYTFRELDQHSKNIQCTLKFYGFRNMDIFWND